MKYKIKIKTKNQMFMINGRNVRTPTEAIIDENYLKIIKAKIKYYGLQESKDYEVFVVDSDSDQDYSKILPTKPLKSFNQPIVLNKKNIDEFNHSTNQVKNEIKKTTVLKDGNQIPQIPKIFISSNPILCSDSDKKTEQNIKKDVSDTEVRIGELSKKSSSILDKLLRGEF